MKTMTVLLERKGGEYRPIDKVSKKCTGVVSDENELDSLKAACKKTGVGLVIFDRVKNTVERMVRS